MILMEMVKGSANCMACKVYLVLIHLERVLKPLTPLLFHGTQSKDFPNIKRTHYTIVCQIIYL